MRNKISYKDICFKNKNFNFSKKSVGGQMKAAKKYYIPFFDAAIQLFLIYINLFVFIKINELQWTIFKVLSFKMNISCIIIMVLLISTLK